MFCLKEGSRSDGIDPGMHLLIHMHADYLFSPKGKNVCNQQIPLSLTNICQLRHVKFVYDRVYK